jgi:hypothetical protein
MSIKEPTISDEDFEAVCIRIETTIDGIGSACKAIGVEKHKTTFWNQTSPKSPTQIPYRAERYARAINNKKDWLFEEMHRLVNLVPPTDDNGRTDNGWVTWRKNQVDLIKWTLSKLFPKDFGESTKIEHSGGMEITGARTIDLIPEEEAD